MFNQNNKMIVVKITEMLTVLFYEPIFGCGNESSKTIIKKLSETILT
jgi:hypothetical protein